MVTKTIGHNSKKGQKQMKLKIRNVIIDKSKLDRFNKITYSKIRYDKKNI